MICNHLNRNSFSILRITQKTILRSLLLFLTMGLERDRYGLGTPDKGGNWHDWYLVLVGLGPRYIPEHEDVLKAVHRIMAP